MNRRDFVKTLGSAAVMATAPVAVAAEVMKEPAPRGIGFYNSYLPVKSMKRIYIRKNDSPRWVLLATISNEDKCAGFSIGRHLTGEDIFETGFDPATGCVDKLPEDFDAHFNFDAWLSHFQTKHKKSA